MTLWRFTPFRFCSVAVVAAMFRGLAGDRRGTSASKPGASPGPKRWEPTVSAINSRSWLSWSSENWEPGVKEGCWRPVEREGRSRSSETPGFSVITLFTPRKFNYTVFRLRLASEERWPEVRDCLHVRVQRCVGPSETSYPWSRDFVPKLKESMNSLAERWVGLAWVISDP